MYSVRHQWRLCVFSGQCLHEQAGDLIDDVEKHNLNIMTLYLEHT